MIEAKDVYKSFGKVQALNGVSTKIKKGEVVVIIGPSGSGKSTFLRCLNHLEKIDRGTIIIDTIPLTDSKTNIYKVREEIGMVFQHFNLFPHLTVLRNITLAQIKVRKRTSQEAERIARDLLVKVGIPDKADTGPGHAAKDHAL
jgi:ABC-type polar amino acid transport system ATPase subunit